MSDYLIDCRACWRIVPTRSAAGYCPSCQKIADEFSQQRASLRLIPKRSGKEYGFALATVDDFWTEGATRDNQD